MERKNFVIGYSLDAVIAACILAVEGNDVTFLNTGTLAEPMDAFHDMVTANYAAVLERFLPGMKCKFFKNPKHMYLPYSKVSVTNRNNGVFQLPFSQNTFVGDEGEKFAEAMRHDDIQKAYNDKSGTPSMLISAMRKRMPVEFVETFIRPMQLTRWRGIPLSSLTMYGYLYEMPLEHFGEKYDELYARPMVSFATIASQMLERCHIEVKEMKPSDAGAFIKSKDPLRRVYVMDNRVDQYFDYVCGQFDRVKMTCKKTLCPSLLAIAKDGIYYTPLHEYWALMIDGDQCYKYETELVTTLYGSGITEIPLTRVNARLYDEYRKFITRYGDNVLDLGQRTLTLVR